MKMKQMNKSGADFFADPGKDLLKTELGKEQWTGEDNTIKRHAIFYYSRRLGIKNVFVINVSAVL